MRTAANLKEKKKKRTLSAINGQMCLKQNQLSLVSKLGQIIAGIYSVYNV